MSGGGDVRVERLNPGDADAVAALMREVILALPFYNDEAERSETGRYKA